MGTLKEIAAELTKIGIYGTGNVAELVNFACKARGDTITCRHGDIRVVISGFQQVDPKSWNDTRYPVIEPGTRIVRLKYEADVQWSAGKVKGAGHCVLGHPLQRDRLLGSLELHSVERGVIDTPLMKTDQLAGQLLPDNLPPAGTINAADAEDDRPKPKWKIF